MLFACVWLTRPLPAKRSSSIKRGARRSNEQRPSGHEEQPFRWGGPGPAGRAWGPCGAGGVRVCVCVRGDKGKRMSGMKSRISLQEAGVWSECCGSRRSRCGRCRGRIAPGEGAAGTGPEARADSGCLGNGAGAAGLKGREQHGQMAVPPCVTLRGAASWTPVALPVLPLE